MFSIAIDGPSGAGKSSISKTLAECLNFIYVDTGAIYRAFAYSVLKNNINIESEKEVSGHLKNMNITIKYIESEQHTFLNDIDVSDKIRNTSISTAASVIAIYPDVRVELIKLQRNLAKNHSVIMDGRDIGTVVLPNANIKIYLTASPEERAKRRMLQLEKQGIIEEYDYILKQIIERDYSDTNKSGALKQAEDAILINSTNNEKSETVEIIYNIIKERLGG